MIAASIVLLRTGGDAIAITGWGLILLWLALIVLAPWKPK